MKHSLLLDKNVVLRKKKSLQKSTKPPNDIILNVIFQHMKILIILQVLVIAFYILKIFQ